MKVFVLITSFCMLATVHAKIGDKCRTAYGTGVCKKVSSCTSGFTTNGDCPNDPADVKCCVGKSCSKSSSVKGICLDDNRSSCSGGHFETGLCPGPKNIRCCVKDSKSPSNPPPTPKYCPAWRKIDNNNALDDYVLSRSATHRVPMIYKGEQEFLNGCALIAAVITAEAAGIGAIPCGVASIAVDWLGSKAAECDAKSMCLKLKWGGIPSCVGGNECCDNKPIWVDPPKKE